MKAWMITSSVLILMVVALRTVLKGKISLKLQNALWLLVLVRLLIPVNPLSSSMSVLNAVPETPRTSVTETAAQTGGAKVSQAPASTPAAVKPARSPVKTPDTTPVSRSSAPSAAAIARLVWLCGAGVFVLALLVSNLRFRSRLRRTRKPLAAEDGTNLPVYLAHDLPSPCLFGLLHPAVYLPPEAAEDPAALRHILVHEDTHFRRGDNWWNLLRCAALALHWYNPLVWLAALLSRRDTELACDEAAVKRLGEEQRADYGKTLITMASRAGKPADLLCCATTMTSGKRGLRERVTLLAKKPRTAVTAALCLLLAVCVATGCTFTGAKSAASSSKSASAEKQSAKSYTPQEAMQVYKCGDIQIGIPKKYLSQLTIDTTQHSDESGTMLINVSETASIKAAEKDGYKDDGGYGNLFYILRLTRAQYEQTLAFEYPGLTVIGYTGTDSGHHYTFPGGKYYYACVTPTDVRYYRSKDTSLDPESADFKNWGTLCEMNQTVIRDILGRNGLTPCDAADGAAHQTYTYDSKHAFVRYYCYYTKDGSRAEYDTLVLSQPAKQGKGGIWCVERVLDEYGQTQLLFPGGKKTTASYYAALQKQCDAGKQQALLDPMSVAKRYVTTCGSYNDTPVDGSFRQVKKINRAYMHTNETARSLVSRIVYDSGTVRDSALLTCFGSFTADNWGVLGRGGFYPDDWWTPLQKALAKAAVGDDQDFRDESILHLYLSYPKNSGVIVSGLTAILQKQVQADRAAFSTALGKFSAEDQARVRALPGLQLS